MNNLESKIRDYLADHLECLKEDLSLIQKEYQLPNLFGAGGFIDILARDPFGHYVVVEIKRSNQSARAALHELTKYIALLKASLGLPPERIRAMLLSTEWYELGVPFSEYVDLCEVETSGYMIKVLSDGTVISSSPFIPLERKVPLRISAAQDLILFASESERNSALGLVKEAASRSSLEDFCLLCVDYTGSNSHVIHPHGIYLIFSSPLLGESAPAQKAIKKSIDWDSELDSPDENFLNAFRSSLGALGDESEIGYPEKLCALSQKQWRIKVAHRHGRYATNQPIFDDKMLIAEAMRVEGGANYYLDRIASPRFAAIWRQLAKDIQLVLVGNQSWEQSVASILREIGRKHSTATASFHIYNPADILLSLAKLVRYDNYAFVPCVEIVVSDASVCTAYIGFLVWNGLPVKLTAKDWIQGAYDSIDKYLIYRHFGDQFIFDDKARELLGIESVVIEIDMSSREHKRVSVLTLRKGRIVRTPGQMEGYKSLGDFCALNRGFAADLIREVATVSLGLVS